ncbi:MAG: 3-methyl-2-oxobutanoate dehydrogenase subunit VorB [Armatimonadetes bacterium]|nr:3-methyl-2-oxobutanoate dehydrogenase subunit VorB [Armatimonadota bacterium]
MSDRVIMKGNEACAWGGIAGGCRHFFGYPITPQNQIPEFMALHLPEVGGTYLQAESEVAAINMCYGAAAAGVRVMTTSSSPGISLMQEGLSYMIGAELPCVIVNVVCGGPGLVNIAPAQSDYFLTTRGCGHGDGSGLSFAPYNVQEMHDWTARAFEIAFRYRTPVTILADAILGQMQEPCTLAPWGAPTPIETDWSVGGKRHGRPRHLINSLYTNPDDLEAINERIFARYREAAANETRWEEYGSDEPELLLCAYGISARVCETAVDWAREAGLQARLLRPISLFPFPTAPLRAWSERVRAVLVAELSMGQFIQDVRLAVEGRCPVELVYRTGGNFLTPEEVLARMQAPA